MITTLTIQEKGDLKKLIKGIYPDKEEFLEYIRPFLTHLTVRDKYERYLIILQQTGINGIEGFTEICFGSSNTFIENSDKIMEGVSTKMATMFSGDQDLSISEFMNGFMNEFSVLTTIPYMEEPNDLVYEKYFKQMDEKGAKLSEEEQSINDYFELLIGKLWIASILTKPRSEDGFINIFLKDWLISYYDGMQLLYGNEFMTEGLIAYIENIKIPNEERWKKMLLEDSDVNSPNPGIPRFLYINEFFSLLKLYFPAEQHESLYNILSTGNRKSNEMLIFQGQANQLGDAFKQIHRYNVNISFNKKKLIKWISANFRYEDGGLSDFKENYLEKIISTNVAPCKNPVIEIKEEDNKVNMYPLNRKGRTSKN